MTIKDRLGSVAEVGHWADSIPFHYEYTAGIAGEAFLRGLVDGKILAGYCRACEEPSLPARTYCVRCYGAISSFVEVGPAARVRAVTSTRAGEGEQGGVPGGAFAYLTFEGARGGMIHRLLGEAPVGSEVVPRFRPRAERVGSILDIQGFERRS